MCHVYVTCKHEITNYWSNPSNVNRQTWLVDNKYVINQSSGFLQHYIVVWIPVKLCWCTCTRMLLCTSAPWSSNCIWTFHSFCTCSSLLLNIEWARGRRQRGLRFNMTGGIMLGPPIPNWRLNGWLWCRRSIPNQALMMSLLDVWYYCVHGVRKYPSLEVIDDYWSLY